MQDMKTVNSIVKLPVNVIKSLDNTQNHFINKAFLIACCSYCRVQTSSETSSMLCLMRCIM